MKLISEVIELGCYVVVVMDGVGWYIFDIVSFLFNVILIKLLFYLLEFNLME